MPRASVIAALTEGELVSPKGTQDVKIQDAGPRWSSSVAQSCLTLCDPMDGSTPGLPVHHQLPELTQTHVSDAIQPSHPPQTAEVHIQGIIPVSPFSYIFPYIEKHRIPPLEISGFPLINNDLLMLRLPALG